MNVFSIVRKNLQKRLLGTVLTILSVTLGAALVIAVQVAEKETERSFNQTSVGYDLILASPGSKMQATLNTIYHLETSTGIIPYGVYQALQNDPRVAQAFPFYVGDSYRGHRVIGTSASFLENAQPRSGQDFDLAEGRLFEKPSEVVIGFETALNLGLKIGDSVLFSHGIMETAPGAEAHVHEDDPAVIVGILNRTATANDRVLFTSVYTTHALHAVDAHNDSHEQEHDHDEHEYDEHTTPELEELESQVTELDAVLVKFNNQALALQVANLLNFPAPQNPLLLRNLQRDPLFPYKEDLMGVIPAVQIGELMSIVGNAEQVLRSVALLVFIVALLGVLTALYNTMDGRKRDIAIMRSLGARRGTIFMIVLLEAATITLLGCLFGLILGHGIIQVASPFITESAGIVISGFVFDITHFLTLLVFTILGILAGLIPAFKAYNTQVVTNLAP